MFKIIALLEFKVFYIFNTSVKIILLFYAHITFAGLNQSLTESTGLCFKKACLRVFQPGPTQPGVYSRRRWPGATNFGIRKKRDETIYIAKNKDADQLPISKQLICPIFSHMQNCSRKKSDL